MCRPRPQKDVQCLRCKGIGAPTVDLTAVCRLPDLSSQYRCCGTSAGLRCCKKRNEMGGQHEVDQIPRDLGWRARRCGGSKFSVRPVLLWLRLLPGSRLRV